MRVARLIRRLALPFVMLCVGARTLGACRGTSDVLIPDAEGYDVRGFDLVRSDTPLAPYDVTGAPALAPDGAVLGTVQSDGAVVSAEDVVVGYVVRDGAVIGPDGAVVGTVPTRLDASTPEDVTPLDAPLVEDGVDDSGAITDRAAALVDATAMAPDGFLPDGAPVCPSGWHGCQGLCIPSSACCVDGDCRDGRVCSAPGGACSCFVGTRMCGTRCIPSETCCTNTDCPSGYGCRMPGEICTDATGCMFGTRRCGDVCIAIGNCCTDADCIGGTCPARAGLCSGMNRCARGARLCGERCIPESTCCENRECTGGMVCAEPGGRCACPRGQRLCDERCIPEASCCTNSDCPITSCPGAGMMCSPVPPRIPVKRWGIDPIASTKDPPASMTFTHFELTTTDTEERALRAAIPDSGGDTPRLSLLTERYFTIHGPGVCPLGTVTLWGLERDAPAWPRIDRILTISPDERRVLVDEGWRATQVGCAMSRTASCPAGTITVNRFVNVTARAERHRYVRTEDIDDAMRAGYTFEAIAFCAW